jgi:hypothetical protein
MNANSVYLVLGGIVLLLFGISRLRPVRRAICRFNFDEEERSAAVIFLREGKYAWHMSEGRVEYCPADDSPRVCTAQHLRVKQFVWAFGTQVKTAKGQRAYRLTQIDLARLECTGKEKPLKARYKVNIVLTIEAGGYWEMVRLARRMIQEILSRRNLEGERTYIPDKGKSTLIITEKGFVHEDGVVRSCPRAPKGMRLVDVTSTYTSDREEEGDEVLHLAIPIAMSDFPEVKLEHGSRGDRRWQALSGLPDQVLAWCGDRWMRAMDVPDRCRLPRE